MLHVTGKYIYNNNNNNIKKEYRIAKHCNRNMNFCVLNLLPPALGLVLRIWWLAEGISGAVLRIIDYFMRLLSSALINLAVGPLHV